MVELGDGQLVVLFAALRAPRQHVQQHIGDGVVLRVVLEVDGVHATEQRVLYLPSFFGKKRNTNRLEEVG